MRTIRQLILLFRVKELWDKVQIVFVAALISLIFTPQPKTYLSSLIVVGFYMLFLGAYGYSINSYADRKQDLKVGRKLELYNFSNRQHLLVFCFLILGSLGIPLCYNDAKIKILGIVVFFLTTFYSVKPIRFKERGILGIIVAALVQRTFPFLFFIFLTSSDLILSWFLLGWLTIIGLAVICAHQLLDFKNDKKAQVKTWAQVFGFSRAKKTTIYCFLVLLAYMAVPPLILGIYNGMAISFVLFVSAKEPMMYVRESLKGDKS